MEDLNLSEIIDSINNKTAGATTVSGTEGVTFKPAPGGGVEVTPSTTVKNAGAAGDAVTGLINKLFGKGALPADAQLGADMAAFLAAAAVEAGIGAVEELAPSAAFIMSALINKLVDNLLQGNTRDLEYIGNYRNPNRILDAGTNIQLLRRGLIQANEVLLDMKKDGLDEKHGNFLIALSEKLIGIGDLLTMYFKGIIPTKDDLYTAAYKDGWNKEDVDKWLANFAPLIDVGGAIEMWRRDVVVGSDKDPFDEARRAGWSDERIAALKAISYKLPQVFDFKDFIIKHVDDPSFVSKYGLDQGINDDYLANAKALGFDEKTARRYYYANWEFPPFFILESMYKAGEIDEQTFTDLLTLQGFPPYFVQKFKELLAPKLTQADIKDMYKYQVITADEIVPKLSTIGITGDLAAELSSLWQASVKLASPLDATAAQAKTTATKQLAEGTILTAYSDRVITKQQALDLLVKAKYDTDEATLLLSIEDYKLGQADIKTKFDIIKQDVQAGTSDMNDAFSRLQALNLTTDQFALYSDELQRLFVHKPKLPSEAMINSWLKKGIYTMQQAVDDLRLLGYADTYIANILIADGATASDIAGTNLQLTA